MNSGGKLTVDRYPDSGKSQYTSLRSLAFKKEFLERD